jgi:hypothetical protein
MKKIPEIKYLKGRKIYFGFICFNLWSDCPLLWYQGEAEHHGGRRADEFSHLMVAWKQSREKKELRTRYILPLKS